jgi:hypothetical protein
MIDELERIWKEVVVAQTMYCPRIWLEVLRKITKRLRIADLPAQI